MRETVAIAERFKGPPTSANGGYASGLAAAPLSGPAREATLRSPPPLETRLERSSQESGAELRQGEAVIATARTVAPLGLEIPEPPSFAEAAAAGAACPWAGRHPYPGCFTCGPDRHFPDGLRMLSGPLPGREVIADTWVPDAGDADEAGLIDELLVWSALDCPSGNSWIHSYPLEGLVLLGRLTVEVHEPVRAGERHIVIGWPIDHEGRKHYGGAALFREDGMLCGSAVGLWIELRKA